MMKKTFGKSHVPLSPAVEAGNLVYISGQVPAGADGKIIEGGIEEQTRQVMENMKAALALAGCKLEDVVKAVAILKDIGDFPGFNKVYGSYFPSEPPARTTLEANLVIDTIKVEIEAIALKPS
jgi:reactive intermediate/imine deaminase